MRAFLEIFGFVAGIMGLVVFCVVFCLLLLIVPTQAIKKYSCTSYGERTNQTTDYSFVNGCMVKVDGTWKPAKNTLEIK